LEQPSDNSNKDGANLFHNEDFIQKVVCLIDIFEKISNLNKSIQGPHINTPYSNSMEHNTS